MFIVSTIMSDTILYYTVFTKMFKKKTLSGNFEVQFHKAFLLQKWKISLLSGHSNTYVKVLLESGLLVELGFVLSLISDRKFCKDKMFAKPD